MTNAVWGGWVDGVFYTKVSGLENGRRFKDLQGNLWRKIRATSIAVLARNEAGQEKSFPAGSSVIIEDQNGLVK